MSEPRWEPRGPVLPKCLVWRELLGRGGTILVLPGPSRCKHSPNRGPEKGSPRGYRAKSSGVPPVAGAVTGR